MTEEKKMISLGELARKLKINKSILHYYNSLGLITPIETVGKMSVMDEESTIERINLIKKYKDQGLSLKQIKEIFDKK